MADKHLSVYFIIFIASLIYAHILNAWKRHDPISYVQLKWLQTVIGVGYVLLFLRLILSLNSWLRVCIAFFASSIPIIARAMIETSNQNREYNRYRG